MTEREALSVTLGDGWTLTAAGVRRERSGELTADLLLANGRPVWSERATLNTVAGRAAVEAAASGEGLPGTEAIAVALLDLVEPALAQVQDAGPKRSKADELVALAGDAELFHDRHDTTYANILVGGHRETHRLRTRGFRRWLAQRFYDVNGKAPGGQALQDALDVLDGQAMHGGPEAPVAVRLAESDGRIYLDLCNDRWEAVEIDAQGWRVVSEPPVRFRRPKGMQPLPTPLRGGAIDDLWQFVNITDPAARVLYVAALVQALRPTGPYPILAIHGEQGSAKTTAARVFRRLTDPNTAQLRTRPRNEHDLMIAATNGWIVGYDNLSQLPAWLSDALCRLSTGGGMSTRELYSDADETLFDAQRPVVLNGIEELATRPDLLDRALVLELPTIPEAERRPEAAVWREFEERLPRLLGALLDAVSGALRELPNVKLATLPRMADFALWATAAEPALGWESRTFMAAYAANRREANTMTLDASPVAEALRAIVPVDGQWTGTASELLAELNAKLSEDKRKPLEQAKVWPKTPQGLSNTLRRLMPNLRADSLDVTFERTGSRRTLRLEWAGKTSSLLSSNGVRPRQHAGTGSDDGLAAHNDLSSLPSPDQDAQPLLFSVSDQRFSEVMDSCDDHDEGLHDYSEPNAHAADPVETLRAWLAAGLLDRVPGPYELWPGESVHNAARFAHSYLAETLYDGTVGQRARDKIGRFVAVAGPLIEAASIVRGTATS